MPSPPQIADRGAVSRSRALLKHVPDGTFLQLGAFCQLILGDSALFAEPCHFVGNF